MGKKSTKEKVDPLRGELLYLSLLNLPKGTRKDGQGKKAQ
jgi:hypothetical protein